MKITINDHRKLFAIQREFQDAFPEFKIEFFGKPAKAGGEPSNKIVAEEAKTVGDCRLSHKKGMLTIQSSMTVSDLKQTFSDVFELTIQVLKKSGNGWEEAVGNTQLFSR
jgi:hypothetical protein